ncbi:UNVERIFIED_CONTAM: hypothetical protein K2H54_019875 [Gekko kuhli]
MLVRKQARVELISLTWRVVGFFLNVQGILLRYSHVTPSPPPPPLPQLRSPERYGPFPLKTQKRKTPEMESECPSNTSRDARPRQPPGVLHIGRKPQAAALGAGCPQTLPTPSSSEQHSSWAGGTKGSPTSSQTGCSVFVRFPPPAGILGLCRWRVSLMQNVFSTTRQSPFSFLFFLLFLPFPPPPPAVFSSHSVHPLPSSPRLSIKKKKTDVNLFTANPCPPLPPPPL